MRLLVYSHNYAPTVGGIATYVDELCRGLATLGLRVCLLAPAPPAAPGAGFAIRALPPALAHDRIGLRGALQARGHLRRALGEARPDALLACQADAVWVSATADLHGVPLVLTLHGSEIATSFDSLRPGALLGARLLRRAVARAARVITVSDFARRRLLQAIPGADPAKVVTVHNGASLAAGTGARPAALDGPGPWLLSVGRLVENKGYARFLPLLARLGAAYPGVRWAIAGDGPDRQRLIAAAQAHGVGPRLLLLGDLPRPQLVDHYRAADLLVHPSVRDRRGREESCSLALIEALAHGCPIAATGVGGIRELVRDGESGLIFDLARPEEAAGLLGALLADAQRRQRFAAAGQRRAQTTHSRAAMAEHTRAVLTAALAGPAH